MTSEEFSNQSHVFDFGDYVIWVDKSVCMGFHDAAHVNMWHRDSGEHGFVLYSAHRIPVLGRIYSKQYKRFPLKRFALWLKKELEKKNDKRWQETGGYKTKEAFLKLYTGHVTTISGKTNG